MALTRSGEQISLNFTEDGYIDVSLLTPPEVVVSARSMPTELPVVEVPETCDVTLESYSEQDPFADTDLPVDMDK